MICDMFNRIYNGMFNGMINGMGHFTKRSMGSCKGTLTGSLSQTLMRSLNQNFDDKFNGNLDLNFNRKIKCTLMGKGEYRQGRRSPGNGKGKRCGGIRVERRDIIIIILFTRATLGTPASLSISILIKQVIVYLSFFLSLCSSMDGQTARPNGLKFGG